MLVKRIKTNSGTYIEPRMEQDWPDLLKLEWRVAVVLADTGIAAGVQEADYTVNWIPIRRVYSIALEGQTIGPLSFKSAWAYLNGITASFYAITGRE